MISLLSKGLFDLGLQNPMNSMKRQKDMVGLGVGGFLFLCPPLAQHPALSRISPRNLNLLPPLWRGAEEKPVDKAQYKGLPRTTAQGLSVMKEPRLGQFLTQRLPPPPRILPPPSSPVRSTPGSNRSSAQREPVPGGDPSGHIGSPRKLGCGLSHSRDGLPLKGFREQQASLEACPGDVASRRQGSLKARGRKSMRSGRRHRRVCSWEQRPKQERKEPASQDQARHCGMKEAPLSLLLTPCPGLASFPG